MSKLLVDSKILACINYNYENQILEIEFSCAKIKKIIYVSKNIFNDLLQASSKFNYHHTNIKNSYPMISWK